MHLVKIQIARTMKQCGCGPYLAGSGCNKDTLSTRRSLNGRRVQAKKGKIVRWRYKDTKNNDKGTYYRVFCANIGQRAYNKTPAWHRVRGKKKKKTAKKKVVVVAVPEPRRSARLRAQG